jgi:hypothetical protein
MPTQFNHRIANIGRCDRLSTVDTFVGSRISHRSADYSQRAFIDAEKIRSQLINFIKALILGPLGRVHAAADQVGREVRVNLAKRHSEVAAKLIFVRTRRRSGGWGLWSGFVPGWCFLGLRALSVRRLFYHY